MLKKLLTLLILLTQPTVILANEFFPEGSISKNQYYDALAYTIGELPTNDICPNCIQYDETQVIGGYTDSVIGNSNILTLTEIYDGYGLRRSLGILDMAVVPPGSRIDFIYYGFNNTQKDIYIDELKVFLSKSIQNQGDITKILDISGIYEDIPLLYKIWNYPRLGLTKTYTGLGMVQYSGNPLNPFILDSNYAKASLQFKSWKVEEGTLQITVENLTEKQVSNTVFRYKTYEEVHTFEPEEEYIFKCPIQSIEENFGLASIYDPNSKRECVVRSEHLESNTVGDSTPLVGVRREGDILKNYVGSRVLTTPQKDSFCISVIPYTLYSGEMLTVKEEDPIETEMPQNEQPIEFDIPEVKGIQKLPQTSYREGMDIKSVVVAVTFLWYYLYRRIIK